MSTKPEVKVIGVKAIAVDGGGTRCRIACLMDQKTEVYIGGPANVFSNFDGTVETINTGLMALSDRLHVPLNDLYEAPTYLGLAGLVDSKIADKLRAAVPLKHTKIEDDRHCAVRGALGTNNGFIAHCGTGSFFAVQRDAQLRLCGGWGPVLDDVAAASWVGRRALALTLYSVDGLYESSTLTKTLLHEHGDTQSIVAFASRAIPAELGKIASLVTNFAQKNDPIASLILSEGSLQIADMLNRLGWHDESICLTGGLGPQYSLYLPEPMRSSVVPAKSEPLQGAIELAEEFRLHFMNSNR